MSARQQRRNVAVNRRANTFAAECVDCCPCVYRGMNMATSELAARPNAPRGKRKARRYFFVGMAAFAVAILALAFVPEFIRFARGTFPIAWVLHIHAAIMAAWVASFIVQA